ncbi:MAG: toxin-antitoxin system YwqK family antitoxin [Paludibacteraceae bacterium]|nr:toxin-antitoxin system YwqK family antitoxin [Paludibacteraceae bacterium]
MLFRVRILMFLLLVQACAVMAQEPEYRAKNYPDGGGLMYDGYFIGDKPVSITRYFEDGRISLLQQFDADGNSTVVMYTVGATPFAEGAYKGKERDGVWKFYSTKDGHTIMLITYNNGVKDGQYIEYFDNGVVLDSMNYSADKIEGERTKYFKNGQKLAVMNYKAGVADGHYVSYFDTGELDSEGNFKNGKRDGVWKFTQANGTVKEYKFKDGKCKKYEAEIRKEVIDSDINHHIAEPSLDDIR